MSPESVEFLRRFGLKTVIDFAHFGLESGVVFEGTTEVYERIYRFDSKLVRKKEKYVNSNVRNDLPSPYTASFQALSVNAFRWRIRDERPGDASKTFSDHVTRNASAAHNNEA